MTEYERVEKALYRERRLRWLVKMDDLHKLVKQEISGSSAKHYVSRLCSFHRIQASPMFREALDWVREQAERNGLKELKVESFPADGKHRYWTYYSPPGWSVHGAELRMVEPEEQLLARFEDIPQSLHTFSKGTPSGGVAAELVDVGTGLRAKDYVGKRVKGKLVLASGRGEYVHRPAVVERGALGVITDSVIEMPHVREGIDIPDAHGYQGIWPRARDMPKIGFGFSVSKRQGNHLRDLLREGKKVKLLAKVDAKLFPSTLDLLTGVIKGESKPEEEVILMAHLCHPKPSANDNASGCACLLEVARTLSRLISSGKVKRPARSIRFLWMPETNGSVAYLSTHKDARDRIVAGINLDMVGENQELCRSTLNLDCTPDSLPSWLNDYVSSLIEQTASVFDRQTHLGHSSTFRYSISQFSAGSDHTEFNEAGVGIPCIMLLQWPDMFYHTSMDTIDKVSEDSLRRAGWTTAVAALGLANADEKTAFEWANLTIAKGSSRIMNAGTKAAEDLFSARAGTKAKDKAKKLAKLAAYHRTKLEHVSSKEQAAVRSVTRLADSHKLHAFLDKHCMEIEALGRRERDRFEEIVGHIEEDLGVSLRSSRREEWATQDGMDAVPKKLFKGTLCYDVIRDTLNPSDYDKFQDLEESDPDFYKKSIEILNFMDGRRSVADLVRAVSAEYSPTDPKTVRTYVEFLRKMRLVEFA
jgi:hypothetical protein